MGGGIGENGEIAGIAHKMWVVECCGAMRLGELGQKWEKTGTKHPFFAVPFPPFSRRSKIFPTVPFVRNDLIALTDGKTGSVATPRHPSPRRLVRMVAMGAFR